MIAAALEAGCDMLWSEDLQHGRRLGRWLWIGNLFRSEDMHNSGHSRTQ